MTVSPTLRPTAPPARPRLRGPARLRFDVDMFTRFCKAELPPDARVELIDGEIYTMSPTGDGHNAATVLILRALFEQFSGTADILPSSSVRMGNWSMPMPDFAVLKRTYTAAELREHSITAADCALVIEISHSTLRFDRRVKAPMYARAGVPEYWVVAVAESVIEVHREPRADGKGYASVVRYGRGEAVVPAGFGNVRIGLDEVFGPTGG